VIFILLYVLLAASLFLVRDIHYHLAAAAGVTLSLLFLPRKMVKGGLVPITVFLLFTFCGNLFFHSGRILYGSGFLSITDEGLVAANVRTLRLFSMIYGAKILTFVLPPERMIGVLGRVFSPLERIGIPAGELFSVMGLTLKSFPLLTSRVSKAYRENMDNRESEGFRSRIKHLVSFLLPVFVDSIRSPEDFFGDEKGEVKE
jgi:energy-coupling factor transport system permease protein